MQPGKRFRNRMEEMKSIYICVPCYEGKASTKFIGSFALAISDFTVRNPNTKVQIDFRSHQFITYARQKAHETALLDGYEYILWWDCDIIAPSNCITRLSTHEKEIVGALVFARTPPFNPVTADTMGNILPGSIKGTGLKKVGSVGTGLMLMNTKVIQSISKPWWEWPNDGVTAEDFYMCKKLRKQGKEIYVDTDLEVGHIATEDQVVDSRLHQVYLQSIKSSGIMNDKRVRSHKDFKKLEGLIRATQ